MSWLDWLRPPRNLLTLYLAGTLAAAAALAWLGWRLLEQERVLERTRAQERLETAADRVVALLQRSLDDLERQSSASAAVLPEDTVVLTADGRNVTVWPPNGLVFYPFLPEAARPPRDVYRAGETAEFAGGDPATAITIYRALARSKERAVRAGALVRLGRCLRKAGRPDEALQVYSDLAGVGAAFIEELPADLVAREARCTVLEEQGRLDALEREARELHHDLARGRWPLRRAAWEFLMGEVGAWVGSSTVPLPNLDAARALSEAAEFLWKRRSDLPPTGHAVSFHGGRPVLSVWTTAPGRLVAVVAGRAYLEAISGQAAAEARVRISLQDRDGQVMLGQVADPRATRTAAATRLPWTLHVSSDNPAGDLVLAGARRRTLVAGLAILGALILASGYFTFRGIRRELAVQRLQSEFVSAVSHEFRTPLTSMRQLSEMLSKGRVISEDRRQQYYDVLTRESERLHRLVEGLLNFGRAEAGVARYHMQAIELGEFVRAVVAEFQREAAPFQVELSLDGAPCPVRGEREMLSLALWNLLDNAMKYSPECRTVWVSLSRNGNRAAIAVRDQGVGIPRHEQSRIFKKFVRGEATMDSGVKGKGIGLAMVSHVARAHGGQVHLQSEVGRGSTFTLLLPLHEPSPAPRGENS
jgi:signal transduction histidine kinase